METISNKLAMSMGRIAEVWDCTVCSWVTTNCKRLALSFGFWVAIHDYLHV